MAFSDCSGSLPGPSALACWMMGTRFPRPPEPSQVLALFAFRHAMLLDSAEVSGALALTCSYLLPSRLCEPVGPRTMI